MAGSDSNPVDEEHQPSDKESTNGEEEMVNLANRGEACQPVDSSEAANSDSSKEAAMDEQPDVGEGNTLHKKECDRNSGSKRSCPAVRQVLPNGKKTKGRVKIKMEYIGNKLRRYTTFSKRKTGIMKKAHELATLTGTQVMLLVASETGHVYAFATGKFRPMIVSDKGKELIQSCLNAPDDNDNDCAEGAAVKTEFTFEPGNFFPSSSPLPTSSLSSSACRKRKLADQSTPATAAGTRFRVATTSPSDIGSEFRRIFTNQQLNPDTDDGTSEDDESGKEEEEAAEGEEEGGGGIEKANGGQQSQGSSTHSTSNSLPLSFGDTLQFLLSACRKTRVGDEEAWNNASVAPSTSEGINRRSGTGHKVPNSSSSSSMVYTEQSSGREKQRALREAMEAAALHRKRNQAKEQVLLHKPHSQKADSSPNNGNLPLPFSRRGRDSPPLVKSATSPPPNYGSSPTSNVLYQVPQGVVYAPVNHCSANSRKSSSTLNSASRASDGELAVPKNPVMSVLNALLTASQTIPNPISLAAATGDPLSAINPLHPLFSAALCPHNLGNLTMQQLFATVMLSQAASLNQQTDASSSSSSTPSLSGKSLQN